MSKHGKDTKHSRQISRRVNFVRNGEKCKLHNIDWCKGGMQVSDKETNNVGENDLNTRMKYVMVKIFNRQITLVK